MHDTKPRLEIQAVAKTFGATRALRGVSLEVGPGEALAVIGENGAGKSTLMKILSGAHTLDTGHMLLDGEPYTPATPLDARRQGVAMIYQELNLARHLTVEENLVLGDEPARWGWLDRKERRRRVQEALARLDCRVHPNAPIHSLTVAEQQMVEITRALLGKPRVLILDEPTSSLTGVEVQRLFAVLEQLRADGVSLLYISHFLEECQQVCSRFTVLRDGQSVSAGCLKTTSMETLIQAMVGRKVDDLYPRSERTFGEPAIEVDALKGNRRPRSVSFRVHAGEVFGLFGLIGAGRTETLRALFGLDPVLDGTVRIRGTAATQAKPWERLKAGMALLSEDRKEEGLLLNRSIAENLLITRPQEISKWGFIRPHAECCMALDWMEHLDVRARDERQSVGELSGGNQQKVAFGRLLYHNASILLLDEPTRGIDVGSKATIYRRIDRAACQGRAVILVSSYIPELLGVCDTVGVVCRGELVAVRPRMEWDESTLIAAAIGQSNANQNVQL